MRGTRTGIPHAGQLLHTPGGDITILGYDHQSDVVITEVGRWPWEDVVNTQPPVGDIEALEAWLAETEWWTETLPLQPVKVEVQDCKVRNLDCDCGDCDVSVHRVRGIETETYHEVRNARCRCASEGCPCLS